MRLYDWYARNCLRLTFWWYVALAVGMVFWAYHHDHSIRDAGLKLNYACRCEP